ncbi:MAG: ArnT family glycosyltransferase [Anaerolineales bacterium]
MTNESAAVHPTKQRRNLPGYTAVNVPVWRMPSRALWGLLAAYAALSLGYNFVQPPFEMSDEFAHFRYVRFLIEEQRFPVFEAGDRSEYHQPPLYYLLSASLSAPFPADDLADYPGRINPYVGFRNWQTGFDNKNLYLHGPWDAWPFHDTALAVRVARLASLFAGALTVLGTYQAARYLLDESGALTAASLTAFNPMFVSVSGSVQNDAGAAAVGTLTLWLGLWLYHAGLTSRSALAWGAVLGLGALTKLTAALLIVPSVAMILFWGQQRRIPFWRIGRYLALFGLGAGLVGGGWYVRNLVLYGEPTGVEVNVTTYGDHTWWEGLAWWRDAIPYTWTTYWGRIGHGDLVLPDWVYGGLGVFVVFSVVGLVWRLFRPGRADAEQRPALAFLLLATLTAFLGLLAYISRSPTGAQGRYLFTVMAAISILIVSGWQRWLPERAQVLLLKLTMGGMALFATLVLAAYLIPAYGPPPQLAAVPASAFPASANLGGVAEIKGYEVTPLSTTRDSQIYLIVYWQPLARTDRPYSVYVHLLDESGTLIAQRDTYPGLGRAPTTAWEIGKLFADRYQVIMPDTSRLPGTLNWKVGLWQAETGD